MLSDVLNARRRRIFISPIAKTINEHNVQTQRRVSRRAIAHCAGDP